MYKYAVEVFRRLEKNLGNPRLAVVYG